MKYLARAPRTALTSAVTSDIKREFGAAVPPFMLHAASPDLFAAVWLLCRETLLVGVVPRERKETVASAVSRLNRCPYCVDAHVTMLYALHARSRAGQFTESAAPESSSDPLVRWAAATRSPGDPALASPPFRRHEAPEIVGTAIFFHYVNRMVSVLLEPSPLPAARLLPKEWSRRLAGLFFGFAARRPKRPGTGFHHLAHVTPDREPEAWAAGDPHIGRASALFARVVDRIEAENVASPVRQCVRNVLSSWRGDEPPLGSAWLDETVEALSPDHRARARLALLAALAPYRVDESEIRTLREYDCTDRALVELLAWASWQAARRIGDWTVRAFA